MSEWTGLSGTNWSLLGDDFGLLIERSVAPETLQLLSECTSIDTMLEALVQRGIEELPGFCLVGFDDNRVTAYLRGGFKIRVEANWHDALTEDAQELRSWRELSIEGVSRFAMLGPSEWHRLDVPIRSFASEREPRIPGVQGLALAVRERLSNDDIPLMTTTTGASPRVDSTPRSPKPETEQQIAAPPEREESEFPAGIFDDLFDDTKYVSVQAAAVREEPSQETGTVLVPPAAGLLILPGGDSVTVEGTLLLGRNPRAVANEPATLVAVFDPNGNISRTHASITQTEAGAMIEDLGSTNGTVVISHTGQRVLEPAIPVQLKAGDKIVLGDDAQLEFRETP